LKVFPIWLNRDSPPPAKQAVNFVFHDAIALTCIRLKAIAIQYADTAATIMDQTGILQVSCSYGDTLPPAAKHIRDELLGHQEIRTIFSIIAK